MEGRRSHKNSDGAIRVSITSKICRACTFNTSGTRILQTDIQSSTEIHISYEGSNNENWQHYDASSQNSKRMHTKEERRKNAPTEMGQRVRRGTSCSPVGNDALDVLELVLLVPHLAAVAHDAGHGGVHDHVRGNVQVGDACA